MLMDASETLKALRKTLREDGLTVAPARATGARSSPAFGVSGDGELLCVLSATGEGWRIVYPGPAVTFSDPRIAVRAAQRLCCREGCPNRALVRVRGARVGEVPYCATCRQAARRTRRSSPEELPRKDWACWCRVCGKPRDPLSTRRMCKPCLSRWERDRKRGAV